MRILWIEDDRVDIYGLEAQCEARGWHKDIVPTFCGAVKMLASEENKYDLVVIDLMLPWGEEATDWVVKSFSDETAGIRLLEAMRGCGEGQDILEKIGMPPLYERHLQTPVIVLSKFPKHEDECRRLDIVEFFCKRDYSWQSLVMAIEGFSRT